MVQVVCEIVQPGVPQTGHGVTVGGGGGVGCGGGSAVGTGTGSGAGAAGEYVNLTTFLDGSADTVREIYAGFAT